MKCTPMKLYSRVDHSNSRLDKYFKKRFDEPEFYTERYYGYCRLSFVRKLLEDPRDYPKVIVKTIKLPENITVYNTGCSLDKWAQKKPRLKSGNMKRMPNNIEVLDENAYDINQILEDLENGPLANKDDCTVSEMNSDIEELWRKSNGNEEDEIKRTGDKKHNKSCKKKKHKSNKYVKYAISKPSSPQTEQVIRVDISSTISVDELKQIQQGIDDSNKSPSKRKKENRKVDVASEEEAFVVRCSQLTIETKHR